MESTFISAPQVLFVCGADRQTHEMHRIAQQLSDCRVWFTPYYGGTVLTMLRELGMLERTIAGNRLGEECLGYLRNHHLPIDLDGRRARYDLVVTCSDLVLARNTRARRVVVVHNGRLGVSHLLGSRIAHRLSRWLGQSPSRWCVTSEADRESLHRLGFPGERITVIGSAGNDWGSRGEPGRPTRIAAVCRDLLGAPAESPLATGRQLAA